MFGNQTHCCSMLLLCVPLLSRLVQQTPVLLTVGPAIQQGLPLFNLAEGLDAQFLAPFTLAIARMPRLPTDIYFTWLFGHQFFLVHILGVERIAFIHPCSVQPAKLGATSFEALVLVTAVMPGASKKLSQNLKQPSFRLEIVASGVWGMNPPT